MCKISDIFCSFLILILWSCISSFNYCNAGRGVIHNNYKRYNAAYKTRDMYSIINPNSLQNKDHITINLVINIDKPLFNSYAKRYGHKAKSVLKDLAYKTIEEVKRSFQHPSLGHTIKIKLEGIRFLRNKTNSFKMSQNGSEYLKSYCDWQATVKTNKDKLWYSVLLSGLDLYYVSGGGNKVWLSEGRGYRNSVCHISKSCTLVEGSSKNLVHVITHELGHSLGIFHDGAPENSCTSKGHIMSKSFNSKTVLDTWSSCSRDRLQKFLKTRKADCLKKI